MIPKRIRRNERGRTGVEFLPAARDESAAAKLASFVGTRTTRSMMSGLADATPPDDAFETADAAIKKLFDGGDFGYHYAMFVQDPAVEAQEPKNYEMPMHRITLMKFSELSGVTPSLCPLLRHTA
jgi:hypothetical protein